MLATRFLAIIFYKIESAMHPLFSVLVKDTAILAEGLGFDSRARPMRHSRQRLAAAATFFRSVAEALKCGDGLRHSLHAAA